MTELFDFGTRPIRVIENNNLFRFVHEKEGWTIAETFQAVTFLGDEAFEVYDGEGEFMGRVVSFGNLGALVSQIYDKEYGPDVTPTQPDQRYPLWVVFAEMSDGEHESATFSREVSAPDLETAKERFLSKATQGADFPPNDVRIISIYGPYMRA